MARRAARARGTLGTIVLISYAIGLVTRQPLDTLPQRLIVLCVGAASAALIRLVLLPENPQRELDRLRRDIRVAISRVIGEIREALRAGGWTRLTQHRLQDRMERLAAMLIMAQTRIAAMSPSPEGLALHLLEVGLATQRTVRTARRDLGPESARPMLTHAATELQSALGQGHLPAPLDDNPVPLAHAFAVMTRLMGTTSWAGPVLETAPALPGPAAVRPAVQAMLAVSLAVIAGHLVSTRWYWASFAAFVMFQGTRSRGESIRKITQFMVGTLAGVAAGMAVAEALSGHELAMIAGILIAVFFAFQAFGAAYGAMVFWITIILGLMFGLLGASPRELLVVRLEEAATLVGAITDAELPSALVALQGRFLDLQNAARPDITGFLASRHTLLRRRLTLLNACEEWARELGRICLYRAEQSDRDLAEAIGAMGNHITQQVAYLTGAGTVAPPDLSSGVTQLPLPSDGESPTRRAAHLLLRIDTALGVLVRLR